MAKVQRRRTLDTVKARGEVALRKLRREAQALIARSRTEVLKDVRAVRETTDRAVRQLERRVVRELHAATTEQVRRLERRVARLERELAARPPTGGEKAA
jgi:hypothetical protein